MIKVVNWSSYQSYKDRKPPWIRFHKTMLDNYEFQTMSADARALLPMLWLLASEDNDPVSGCIRDSYEKITFRLRMDKNTFESALIEIEKSGFITLHQAIENKPCNQSVTKPLQERNSTVTPETETETETDNINNNKRGARLSDDWQATDDYINFALGEGLTLHQANLEADKFKDYWISRSDKGAIKKDWLATWRNWIRNNKGYKNDRTKTATTKTDRAKEAIARAYSNTSGMFEG